MAGLVVLILLILIAIFAPLLALHDPTQFYFNHKLEPPNSVFPLGTDNLGRDVYSRMLYGARISLPTGLDRCRYRAAARRADRDHRRILWADGQTRC